MQVLTDVLYVPILFTRTIFLYWMFQNYPKQMPANFLLFYTGLQRKGASSSPFGEDDDDDDLDWLS